MDLKFKSYLRYCDDFALFSNDKKELADIRSKLESFIHNKLHLKFSKSEIFHVKNGVDFLGFRHFKGFKLLRKRMSVKIKRELRNIRNNLEKSFLYERFLSTIDSYMGWLKWCNSFNFINKYDILNLRQVLKMYENIPSFSQLWESTKKGFLIGETIGIEKIFDKGIIVSNVAFRTVKSKKTSDNEETCVIQFSFLDDINKTKYVTFTRSKKIIGKIKDVHNPDSDFICFKCKIVKEENGTFDIL